MEKRIVCLYVIMLVAITGIFLRLTALVTVDSLATAAYNQSSYVLEVGESRGFFYDRNLKPLVNRDGRTVLAVAPTPGAMEALQGVLPRDELEQSFDLMKGQKPLAIAVSHPAAGEGVLSFQVPVRYRRTQLALHLIGYTDSAGVGVCGLEKGHDEQLSRWGGSITVKYLVNAAGNAISPEAQDVADGVAAAKGGMVLTLDREIQEIVEEAMAEIPKGAAVVMKAGTGEILAAASRPTYDVGNLGAALDDPDSPFFDRALGAYNVGSSFKICVAAAALEAGYSPDYKYECTGSYTLGEQVYYCNRRVGHGELTLTEAIEQSCNPFFINLGQKLGYGTIYQMAYAMGFGSATRLGEGVYAASGSLPEPGGVGAGELANISFGQGRLTATPVQMAQMLSIVAGDGMWVSPTVLLGTTEDGVVVEAQEEEVPQKRVMSSRTAATLRTMLIGAVEEGSGRNAKPQLGGAGGKTSSAQTGSYKDGDEIVHAWFAGFFPAEEPEYVVVVFVEGGGEGGLIPAGVFKRVSEEIQLRKLAQSESFLR